MLLYFLQRGVGEVLRIDFNLNRDADLTEWRSLVTS